MASVPPWLNVSPSDFLRAMQAGATSGLQVAQLRQSGSLERDRLAQQAALAAAARSEAAQARADNLAFQQWERGELARQAAEENARQERVAMAGLEQRSLESALSRESTERHRRAMEETAKGRLELGRSKLESDLNRIKARLDVPTRYHLTTVEGKVIATDPITGESFVAYPKQAATAAATAAPIDVEAEVLPQPFDLQRLDPRLIQGPFGGPLPPGPFSFPGPAPVQLPAPSAGVKRYLFKDGKLTEVK